MIHEDDLLQLVDAKLSSHIFSKFKHCHNDDISACLKELLKYLYLSSKYTVLCRNFIPVTQEVDNFWHEVILQTLSYQKLCAKLPGGKMVHHESLDFVDYRSAMAKKELIEEVLRWIVLYVRNFGDMKEDRLKYWFFIDVVKKTLNISLHQINLFAKNDTYFKIHDS